MSGVVTVGRDGGVARVTMARPEVRNAFNAELIADLHDAFTSLAAEPAESLRAVVLAGEGAAFCAGADVAWMQASGSRRSSPRANRRRTFATGSRVRLGPKAPIAA